MHFIVNLKWIWYFYFEFSWVVNLTSTWYFCLEIDSYIANMFVISVLELSIFVQNLGPNLESYIVKSRLYKQLLVLILTEYRPSPCQTGRPERRRGQFGANFTNTFFITILIAWTFYFNAIWFLAMISQHFWQIPLQPSYCVMCKI